MAKTFTVGFGAKGEKLDKFELGDVMDDEAESHADPYGDEESDEVIEDDQEDQQMGDADQPDSEEEHKFGTVLEGERHKCDIKS